MLFSVVFTLANGYGKLGESCALFFTILPASAWRVGLSAMCMRNKVFSNKACRHRRAVEVVKAQWLDPAFG